MEPRVYFIPGLSFERLAADDQALKGFQQLLNSIKSANWNVFKAEETDDNGLLGMTLFMKPFLS
jgi:hypothetical protein